MSENEKPEIVEIQIGRLSNNAGLQTPARTELEIRALSMLRNTGHYTLEEFGEFLGLTGERVRQILPRKERRWEGPAQNKRYNCPLTLLRILRSDPTILSWANLEEKTGHYCTSGTNVRRLVNSVGMNESIKRLFRLRKWVANKPLREATLEDLRRVSRIVGHTAKQKDISLYGKYNHVTYYNHFGSLRRAQELAGLEPNDIGGGRGPKPLYVST